MKYLGYFFITYAVLVAALAIFDSYIATADQIWSYMNIVSCASLAICVLLGIRYQIQEVKGAIEPAVLLSIFAFVVFTETWIEFLNGTTLAPQHWLWVDAIIAIALLRVGSRLVTKESAA